MIAFSRASPIGYVFGSFSLNEKADASLVIFLDDVSISLLAIMDLIFWSIGLIEAGFSLTD